MEIIFLACVVAVIVTSVFGLCVNKDTPQRSVATMLFLVAMVAFLWRLRIG
jgi:fucose permease